MDARQQRGLFIAAIANLVKAQRGAYFVPRTRHRPVPSTASSRTELVRLRGLRGDGADLQALSLCGL